MLNAKKIIILVITLNAIFFIKEKLNENIFLLQIKKNYDSTIYYIFNAKGYFQNDYFISDRRFTNLIKKNQNQIIGVIIGLVGIFVSAVKLKVGHKTLNILQFFNLEF